MLSQRSKILIILIFLSPFIYERSPKGRLWKVEGLMVNHMATFCPTQKKKKQNIGPLNGGSQVLNESPSNFPFRNTPAYINYCTVLVWCTKHENPNYDMGQVS